MTQYNGIEIDYTRDSNLSEFGLTLLKEKYLVRKGNLSTGSICQSKCGFLWR